MFSPQAGQRKKSEAALIASLSQHIGQWKVLGDCLEKKQNHSVETKRALIEPGHADLRLAQPCKLLGLARSRYASDPVPESEENLVPTRMLDEQETRTPFSGSRKMAAWLDTPGYPVERKRVGRLLHLMGLEAIAPQPRTSLPGAPTQRYPYFLRGMSSERGTQGWSGDITDIRLPRGFIDLIAVIDGFRRDVLAREISIPLDTRFCLQAQDRALHVATPEIFQRDQGVQFTRRELTNRLKSADLRSRWDGRGRA